MKKLFLLLTVALLSSPLVFAQDIAEQPCDTQYWRQMSARAWMEAEREIMQNQNLIFKPDSVLEYVCFDQFESFAAWRGGNIFVHTDYFGKKIITREQPEAMHKVMASVVSAALSGYKTGNFSHTFLGGRSFFMGAEMTNSAFKPATDGSVKQDYTCQTMSKVWKAAKCANFIDNASFESTDGFYPFDPIKGYKGEKDVDGYSGGIQEVRQYPSALSCVSGNTRSGAIPPQELGAKGKWTDQLKFAENTKEELYDFQTILSDTYLEVGLRLKPGECGSPPIETGITVVAKDGDHPDGICTNPGCTYTKEGKCE